MRTITLTDGGAVSTLDVYQYGVGSPALCITAGIHGNEFGGIYVAERLREYFAKHPPLRGSVRILPRCNPAASRCMERRSPFDGEDMNRIFPGDSGGSISHKVAAAVWEETRDAEMLVDLHCCGQHGTPYLLATYEEHPAARDLARRIPLPVAIRSEGTPGQLFTTACRQRDQAALVIEIPSGPSSGAIHQGATQLVLDALLDFLRALGMAEGTPQGSPPGFCGPLLDADLPRGGLWEPSVKRGEYAAAGQPIGLVDGEKTIMPEDGLIMAVRPKGYVFSDDLWGVIYTKALE